MKNVVITSAVRTPIGDHMGKLSSLSTVELGTIAAKAAIDRSGIEPFDIKEVTGGVVYKAGQRGNPARQVQLACGIPEDTSACTVDQQCASGMRAFEIAYHQILLGNADTALAVGMESMSRVPYLMLDSRNGKKMGDIKLVDGLTYDALFDAMLGRHMGTTAETLASQYGITREEQDELAMTSHTRACNAIETGRFKAEIVPVEIKNRKSVEIVDTDEHPRRDISLASLGKLRPAFIKNGTVTAGNSSGINDGAAATVLMSEEYAAKNNIKPLARVLATASYGVKPEVMGIGPAFVIPKVIEKANLRLKDIDYFEINEAFAAQFLAVNRVLNIDMNRVNANGSGIALGHPVGCTGIRIIASMIYEMRRRRAHYGIASLCVGGGPAMATLIELL